MTLYYARFKHVMSESSTGLEDLMGFFNIDDSNEVEPQIEEQFEKAFDGKYKRSYTLRDFGPVKIGKGYKVKQD